MNRLHWTIVPALLLGTAVSPASADIIDVTYTGVVSSAVDQSGLFGPVGTNLVGAAYTAQYVFNTSLGISLNSPTEYGATGGWTYGNVATPLLSAAVTINGYTVSIGPAGFQDEIYGDQTGTFGEFIAVGRTNYDDANGHVYNYVQNDVHGADPTIPKIGPFTYDLAAAALRGDAVTSDTLYSYQLTSGPVTIYTHINADLTSMTVSGAVPEPATWALLLLGFGGLGLAAHRRASRPATRAA